jgi:hypothetical protein
VSGLGVQNALTSAIATKKNILALSADERDARLAQLQPAQDALLGYVSNPSEQAYAQAYQEVAKIEPDVAKGMTPPGPGVAPKAEDLNYVLGATHALGTYLANQKTTQETKTSAAQAGEAGARATQATAEAQKIQQVADLQKNAIAQFQQDPTKGGSQIHAMFQGPNGKSIDPQAEQAWTAAYNSGMATGGPEAAQAAVTGAAAHVGRIAEATNPLVQQSKVAEDVARETQLSPVRIREQIAAAQALRSVNGPEFSGVPVGDQPKVIQMAQGIDNDYAVAKGAQDQVGRVIKLAETNPAAGANVASLMTAASLATQSVKRLSGPTLAGNEAPGSIAQDIEGKIQKWAGNGPMPPEILNDFRQLNETLAAGALDTYKNRLATLSRYGAQAKPNPALVGQGGGAPPIVQHSPSTGQYRYSTDGGKTWQPGQPPNQR